VENYSLFGLNGYPGPAHVLQPAGQLRLTDARRRDVQAIFDRMSAAAKLLGELIAQEQALDRLFANGDITPDRLAAATRPLPNCEAACATPTSSAGHAPAGAKTFPKLTFQPDHLVGA
jgi:hypothetical protein